MKQDIDDHKPAPPRSYKLEQALGLTSAYVGCGMVLPTTPIVLAGCIGFAGIALVINFLIFFPFGGI